VRNTPAHLPEGDTQRLFDRFYRGDPARTQKSGGYGIGLSAARAIAETWKGTLTARQEGETAIFTLKL
jgi:signal transduction histidine kinase